MSKRPPIPKSLRFEIFKRDGFRCVYCGRQPPEVVLQADHVEPVKLGGTTSHANLVTSCAECNLGKSCVPLDCLPRTHAESVEERREKLEQMKAMRDLALDEADYEDSCFLALSRRWVSLCGLESDRYIVPGYTERAMRRFIKLLPLSSLIQAIDAAWNKIGDEGCEDDRTKYFCGCCWKMIRNNRNAAKAATPGADGGGASPPAMIALAGDSKTGSSPSHPMSRLGPGLEESWSKDSCTSPDDRVDCKSG